ncbi:hypothetical protein WN51_07475 [Melipona quadrifasciata]|uniref:Uncharacterized protein n=1 Tax=Melipona quadrifasciata TaxID=166423 RepID=A0A0N0BJ96_9HYME|nr:hypothetical protein WN51_07475 [Melipona quadrifasciata]
MLTQADVLYKGNAVLINTASRDFRLPPQELLINRATVYDSLKKAQLTLQPCPMRLSNIFLTCDKEKSLREDSDLLSSNKERKHRKNIPKSRCLTYHTPEHENLKGKQNARGMKSERGISVDNWRTKQSRFQNIGNFCQSDAIAEELTTIQRSWRQFGTIKVRGRIGIKDKASQRLLSHLRISIIYVLRYKVRPTPCLSDAHTENSILTSSHYRVKKSVRVTCSHETSTNTATRAPSSWWSVAARQNIHRLLPPTGKRANRRAGGRTVDEDSDSERYKRLHPRVSMSVGRRSVIPNGIHGSGGGLFMGLLWLPLPAVTSCPGNHQIPELIEPLMKRLDAVFAFVGLRQVAARLLENHDGNKLRFYDHLNRIVKVRAFKLIVWLNKLENCWIDIAPMLLTIERQKT